jgi:AcrR family transcriptional regulator
VSGTYSEAQRRTLAVALDLFADHGVGGTSLQMIADRLGVTKAAVYHQFRTKDALVLGTLEVELARVEEALGSAESPAEILARLVDVTVTNRRAVSTVVNDPVFVRLLGEDERSRHFWARLYATLVGDGSDDAARVKAAALSATIGSVGSPFVADMDDEKLKAELLRLATRLLA